MTVCWTLGVELMSLVHCDLGKTTLFPLFLVFLRELTFAATEIVEGQLSICGCEWRGREEQSKVKSITENSLSACHGNRPHSADSNEISNENADSALKFIFFFAFALTILL
jgi:hypothetical protein